MVPTDIGVGLGFGVEVAALDGSVDDGVGVEYLGVVGDDAG